MRCMTIVTGLSAALLAGSNAWGVVESIDATVTAEVQEFVNGSPGDSDLAFEDFEETTANLPLSAQVEFFETVDGEDEAGAIAITTFFDPRASLGPDPDEFGLNASTFSLRDDLAYLASSESTETRQITFLASELGGVTSGSELEVQSTFFVDGIMLVWGAEDQIDLAGTVAEMNLSVVQTLPDSGAETVLTASLTLTGQADGSATLSTSGGLVADNVVVLDLSDQIDEYGSLQMVIIPATTALTYEYPAIVDEPFELKAEIACSARSQPMTGAAVQLGIPLLELAALVGSITGEGSADILQDLIDSVTGASPVASRPLVAESDGTTVRVVREAACNNCVLNWLPTCGTAGLESAMLLGLMGTAAGFCTVRRRR